MTSPRMRPSGRMGRSRLVRSEFVPSSAAVRERGYARGGAGAFWEDLTNEQTPEMRWPESIPELEAMVRQDAQASSVLSAVATPIMRTTWRLDGTGCRPEVVAHVAADMGLPIVGEENKVPATRTRGRFSWTDHLSTAVPDHLQFGHAVFEQVYYPVRPISEGGDGLFHLRKLGYRPARTIAAWNVAPDGGLISIQQHEALKLSTALSAYDVGSTGEPLGVDRLVVYVNKRKGANWIGESVLRAAYKNVKLKDAFLRIDAQVVERNGLGIPVHTAGSNDQEHIDAGQEIVENLRAGDNSGASLGKDAKLALMGVTGTLPDILDKVKYHDEQISRSVLAHFLNLGSQTGSWALGSTFADFFTLAIQAVAENIRETATNHIVEDLVDINYGQDEPAPRLVFDEIGSRQESILASIASLIQAGVLHADEDLEKFIRSALGLPPAPALQLTPQEGTP